MSRTASERGDVFLKLIEEAKEPEILQASPFGVGEDHEKYSAGVSVAIRSCCEAR